MDPNIYPLSEIPSMVNDDDNMMLNSPVSIREIKKSLFKMDPDKAPGPDGFTAQFYIACWDIIKRTCTEWSRRLRTVPSWVAALIPRSWPSFQKKKALRTSTDLGLYPSVTRDTKSLQK